MQYWWGEYDDNLKEKGWIDNGEEPPYKLITTNGKWKVIRFYHDGAFYSWCQNCGYTHSCFKESKDWPIKYDPEKEFNYCPICGTDMLEEDIEL